MFSAENGQEAVDRATAESFDLILMDMQMPVMDGYRAMRELRVPRHYRADHRTHGQCHEGRRSFVS